MSLLFLLNKRDLALAEAEAKAAVHGWGWWDAPERQSEGIVLFPRARAAPRSLALTRRVVRVLAQGDAKDAQDILASVPWARHLKGRRYRVTLAREGSSTLSEKDVARIVWDARGEAAVDLAHPEATVDVVLTPTRAFAGIRTWEEEERFEDRRAHLWKAPHPSAAHPAIARALVNLSCARRIHDPFCGAGGFLIEAGLSGRLASGGDIEPEMVARARANCAAFGLRPQALVCDLPFGKNTRDVALSPLLEAFLLRAHASSARLVIGVPSPLRETCGWRVRAHFPTYVHAKMTRHFYVLDRGPRVA